MILALLILSIVLFCWTTWESAKIPEHKYEEEKEVRVTIPVTPKFIEEDECDEDPPTVVMVKK